MTIKTLDPAGLAPIPGAAHVTIATGSRIVHISGQTGVHADGAIAGPTHAEQATQALRNLRVALDAVGGTPADIARLGLYVVDYSDAAFEAVVGAAIGVFGEAFPITASTLIGVAALWQPGLLFEVDAVLVIA
jgi:enamine deaminase RidA (YjgF/YER057c/UK114 family)